MVEAGLSLGAGLLIGAFGLMLLWGLVWLVVGTVGMARRTCPSVILLSSLSSSAIAGLSIAGLFWSMDPTRLTTPAFQVGIMCQPVAGYILDLVGVRKGMMLFAAAWGTLTMAHGLASGWRTLPPLATIVPA